MSRRVQNGAAACSGRSGRAREQITNEIVADSLAKKIAALRDQGVDALRVAWARRFRCPAPPIQSADVLRRLFSWRLQADTFGDLDAKTSAALNRARTAVSKGRAPVPPVSSAIRAGSVLVREWRGVTRRVLVRDEGFEHEGKEYRTLSEVARAITGTRWSGPRFFGLEEKPQTAKPVGVHADAAP
jgi:hypothetical protein